MPDPFEIGDEIHKEMLARWEAKPFEEKLEEGGLPEENRGSWYCPCAEWRHVRFIRSLMQTFNLYTMFDLGAGDLRLSAAMNDRYKTIAYETNSELLEVAEERQRLVNAEVRNRDYYADWENIREQKAVFACIGKTNELPGTPKRGIAVQGVDELDVVFGEEFRSNPME